MEHDELPEGWVETILENVVEIRDDLRLPINADERSGRIGPYPYYGATGQVGWIDDYLMDGEYILLGEDGAPFLDPFKPKAYSVSGKCWVNNHAHVLRCFEGFGNNKYLMYYLNAFDYREVVNGTTRLKLTQSAMKNIPILLPPLPEQHRIVSIIEQQFSRLDAAVTSLQHARTKLKRQRAAILKAAVEGTLTADWRAQHPASETAQQLLQRILQERRAKWEAGQPGKKKAYKKPEPPDTTNLSELPEGWCWATIEQLADVGTGATPLRGRNEYYMDGKIPWVTSGALNSDIVTSADEFITEKALAETNAKIFPSGTLLLAMYGEGKTRGKISELRIDAATNQACAAIAFRPLSKVYQSYVKYFLLSNYDEIRRLSIGGVQPNLNLRIVKETFVPLPPLSEQQQIVSEVEARLSIIAQTELEVEANLKRAERMRQTILAQAFAGRLVPQDPDDEPASTLLERIRQECRERDGMQKKGKAGNGRARATVKVPDEPVQIDVAAMEQVELWESVGN